MTFANNQRWAMELCRASREIVAESESIYLLARRGTLASQALRERLRTPNQSIMSSEASTPRST